MAITGEAGQTQDFSFTGAVQPYLVPASGIYKLEVWGAGGGDAAGKAGKGGYSAGYKELSAGQTLYVCVGGGAKKSAGYITQGYNGGAHQSASGGNTTAGGGGGGGATHIALGDGTLDAAQDVLIVAGGGGGGGAIHNSSQMTYGGNGGGLQGENAWLGSPTNGRRYNDRGGTGGGQTGGGSGLRGLGASGNGGKAGGGGGGGWFGGGGGGDDSGGGGGSGYIDGVPAFTCGGTSYSPESTQGAGYGQDAGGNGLNGAARLTYMATSDLPVYFDDTHLREIHFDGTKLEHLVYNGAAIFVRRMRARFCRGTARAEGGKRCLT